MSDETKDVELIDMSLIRQEKAELERQVGLLFTRFSRRWCCSIEVEKFTVTPVSQYKGSKHYKHVLHLKGKF